MTLPGTHDPTSPCASECGSCRLGREWAEAEAALPAGRGPSLLAGSLLFFLFPALLAFLGSWLGRPGGPGQLLGGLAGLLVGMGLARWVATRLGSTLGSRIPSSAKDGA